MNAFEMWPRITQAIQLEHGSSLTLALLDFDQVVCKAADTGNAVVVAPGCALALLTGISVLLPSVAQEKRCFPRVKKYFIRGFIPVVVDPYE